MQLTSRNQTSVTKAIDALFYIKAKAKLQSSSSELQQQCQKTIDILIKEFPGLVPMHSKSLAEQDSRIVDETSIARFS